jgi:hypothetical protein
VIDGNGFGLYLHKAYPSHPLVQLPMSRDRHRSQVPDEGEPHLVNSSTLLARVRDAVLLVVLTPLLLLSLSLMTPCPGSSEYFEK